MFDDTDAQIQEIQISLEDARKVVDKRDLMLRLFKSPAFKKLILEGYYTDEPVRLTTMLAHPAQQSPEDQKFLIDQLKAVSLLQQYFNKLRIQGNMMERDVALHEKTLVEIDAEEQGE